MLQSSMDKQFLNKNGFEPFYKIIVIRSMEYDLM